MRVSKVEKPESRREMKVKGGTKRQQKPFPHPRPVRISGRLVRLRAGTAQEHGRQDPKNSELCLQRAKPEETLVEARSDTDVQIVRHMWAKGRKTNRTV